MNPWIDILDVSAANGAIDFERVARAEVSPGVGRRWRGVIAKVSEGETYKDPTRIANIAGARRAGLAWGLYLYLHPMQDPDRQVETAWTAVGDTMPSFAAMIDCEAADPSLTPQQVVDALRRARDAVVARFGRQPLCYSYPDFWTRRAVGAAAGAEDLAEMGLAWASYGAGHPWYPRPEDLPRVPEPWRSAGKGITLWQYSGNTTKTAGAWTGHVDGVYGDVDRNVFVGSEEDFLYDFCGRPRPEQLEKPAAIVHPWPTLPSSDDE